MTQSWRSDIKNVDNLHDLNAFEVLIEYRNMFLSTAKDCKSDKDWRELGYCSAIAAEGIQIALEALGTFEYM